MYTLYYSKMVNANKLLQVLEKTKWLIFFNGTNKQQH